MVTEEQVREYFSYVGEIIIAKDVVDIIGSAYISKFMSSLPFKFGEVTELFRINNAGLTSLVGCPDSVGKTFSCQANKLKSLDGCPQTVGGWFECHNNELESLAGCPRKVENFYCYDNQLTSLIGGPTEVSSEYDCSKNFLTSLEGCPKIIPGGFLCNDNNLSSYNGLPDSVGFLLCDWIENAPILSLLKYPSVNIDNNNVIELILHKYVGQKPLRQAIIKCQRELIDNGFEGNAKL